MTKPKLTLGIDNGLTHCQHWQISERIFAIQNPGFLPGPGRLPGWGYSLSYLIVGDEKALLLDTGFGIADLKSYVESLTALPLLVVNSHVHPDHSGGNRQFDTVYIGQHEWDGADGFVFPIETVPGQRVSPAVERGGSYHFETVSDGYLFDLGNVRLQVVEIPGHTKGSIGLFDWDSHYLFSGDAIVKRIFYGASVPLSHYRQALTRIQDLPVKAILSAHWPEALPVNFIDKVLDLIDHFDPTKSEDAAWDVPDAPDLRMVSVGRDFDDPEFCAMSFVLDQLPNIQQ